MTKEELIKVINRIDKIKGSINFNIALIDEPLMLVKGAYSDEEELSNE